MKFSCTQENLNLGVNIINRVAAKSGNLPILNNILIQCQGGNIQLLGTNLEMGIKYIVRGKIDKDGIFTVPSVLFSDYINLLNDRIDCELKDDVLVIQSGLSVSKIKGLPASEFPTLPSLSGGDWFFCKKQDLVKVINRVIFAVSPAETRPELNGVYLNIDPESKSAVFAATDSYRLAECRIPLKTQINKTITAIIPARTLQELARILNQIKNDSEEIKFGINASQISFFYDNLELISRLIDGIYPDYQQIIPKIFKTQVQTDKHFLIKAIKASSLFAKSGVYDVFIQTQSPENIQVGGANSQSGEYSAQVPAEVSGEDASITFNYRFLLDALQAIEAQNIKLQIVDSNNPILLTPVDNEECRYLIMPIRA